MNLRKIWIVFGAAALLLQITGCTGDDAKQTTKLPEATHTQAAEKFPGRDYLFRDSGTNLLIEENLSNLDGRMLALARNEVFARHGFVFSKKELNTYFATKRWYTPDSGYTGNLSEIEKKNIGLIQKYEQLNAQNHLSVVDTDYHIRSYSLDTYKRQKAVVDLDGDGVPEQIQLTVNSVDEEKSEYSDWEITVNQEKISGSFHYPIDYFQIVDANMQDPYFEIALEYNGDDTDCWTEYYYYNGEKIIPMGQVDGITGNSEVMDGKGKVLASSYASDLQSWYYLEEFRLGSNHQWERVPKEFYAMEPPTPWVAKIRIPLYKAPGSQDIIKWVEPGETVYFVGGDLMEHGKLRTEDGKVGWISVHDNKLGGTDKNMEDCFDGRLLYG